MRALHEQTKNPWWLIDRQEEHKDKKDERRRGRTPNGDTLNTMWRFTTHNPSVSPGYPGSHLVHLIRIHVHHDHFYQFQSRAHAEEWLPDRGWVEIARVMGSEVGPADETEGYLRTLVEEIIHTYEHPLPNPA